MTLTPKQRRLLAELQAERAKAQPDPKAIRRLASQHAAEDDKTRVLAPRSQPGGRSRSPAFGRWPIDDDQGKL